MWLFFDQQLGDPQKRITNWFIRCDDPDAAEPAWSEPVMFAEGCTLNKPTVLKNGDWLLPGLGLAQEDGARVCLDR